MKLHGHPRATAPIRVRIALNLKGIAYEEVSHQLDEAMAFSPEYRGLQPQGLVPALEDEGEVFVQTLAIIEYLDETHREPALLPGHPGDRARVRGLAQIIACEMHPLNNLRVLRYLAGPLGQDPAAVAAWFNHWLGLGFAALEALLAGDDRAGRFCHGDEPGLADIFLVPQVLTAARHQLDMAPFPTVNRIHAACLELDAFRRALPK